MHLVIHRKKHVPSSYPWKKPKVLHIYHHIQIHRNPGSWVLEPPSLCHWDQVESFFGSHSMVLRISRLVFGEGMGSSGTFKAFLAFLMNLLATRKPGTWYGSWKVVMQIWWGLKISPYLSQNRSKYEVFWVASVSQKSDCCWPKPSTRDVEQPGNKSVKDGMNDQPQIHIEYTAGFQP